MNLLQKINAIWQKVGVVQRALLIAIVLACGITGVLLTKWASKADMQMLYSGLTAEEAGKVVDKIGELDIRYELRGNGTTIYVPSGEVHRLRLTMAKDGLPTGGKIGIDGLDDGGLGESPDIQQIKIGRAIQQELAQTIQYIDGVVSARVHIARPERRGILATDNNDTKATVMLVIKPGWTISRGNIAAITNLIASAVDGLLAENVTVTDSQGRLLTRAGGRNELADMGGLYKDYKGSVEQAMNDQIRVALEKFLGPNRVAIMSNAVIDPTNEETVTTKYEKGIAEEETIESETTTPPTATDSDGNVTTTIAASKTSVATTKSKVPETIQKKTTIWGAVQSWSVTAMVDLSVPPVPVDPEEAAAAGGATATATAAATTGNLIMSIEDVEDIIKTAIGGAQMLTDPTALTVKNVPIYRAPVVIDKDGERQVKWGRYIEIARQSSLGLLAVCALIVLKIFTKAGKSAGAPSEAGAARQLAAPGMGILPPATGDSENTYRQHIIRELKQNPDQVRQLFAGWLAEGS